MTTLAAKLLASPLTAMNHSFVHAQNLEKHHLVSQVLRLLLLVPARLRPVLPVVGGWENQNANANVLNKSALTDKASKNLIT